MFSQTLQFYSTPLSSRDHLSNGQQCNGSGSGRTSHEVTLHQKLDFLISANTKQAEEMAKLRADNDNLQRELESMKENIVGLKSQVTAAPSVRGTSYSRVPPDVSVSSIIYVVTWCAYSLGLPYHFYSTYRRQSNCYTVHSHRQISLMESLGTSLSMDKWHIHFILLLANLTITILPIISYNHPKNTAV